MKITLSIISVAILASIFTTPVSSHAKLTDYSNQLYKLDQIDKELDCIKEELEFKKINQVIAYKNKLKQLEDRNKELIEILNSKDKKISQLEVIVQDTIK